MQCSQFLVKIGRSALLVTSLAAVAAVFSAPARAQSTGKAIDWNTSATDLRGQNGQRFAFTLPANGSQGRLWGTDVYTDDSSIGTAAVHAGLISLAQGGTVTIEIRPGQSTYTASTRNGITSTAYGSWVGSYVFVGSTPTPNPTPDPNVTAIFNGIWSSDLGFYIGLVQNSKSVIGYYYGSDGNWYRLLTGQIKGNVLEGKWDVEGWTGGFRFTLSANGKSFSGVGTDDSGWVTFEFSGQFYSGWQ